MSAFSHRQSSAHFAAASVSFFAASRKSRVAEDSVRQSAFSIAAAKGSIMFVVSKIRISFSRVGVSSKPLNDNILVYEYNINDKRKQARKIEKFFIKSLTLPPCIDIMYI